MTVAAPQRPGLGRPHWRYRLRQLAWTGIDVLFTPDCGGCERRGQRFCAACRMALDVLPAPICQRCGEPVQRPGRCRACRTGARRIAPLSGLRSVAYFDGPLQKALHRLKYKRDIILADSLARLLVEAWSAAPIPGDVVVAVPLSAQRLRERGYNQAGLLARAFAELAGLAWVPGAAVRMRHTASQVGLPVEMRWANVQGAFRAVEPHVAGRSIILVDDVCTTGATLAACAEALCSAGAATVWGFTLGRARFARVA